MDANQEQPAVTSFDDLPDHVRYEAILQRSVPGLIAAATTLKEKVDIKSVPFHMRKYITTPVPIEVFFAVVYLLQEASKAAVAAETSADKVAGA